MGKFFGLLVGLGITLQLVILSYAVNDILRIYDPEGPGVGYLDIRMSSDTYVWLSWAVVLIFLGACLAGASIHHSAARWTLGGMAVFCLVFVGLFQGLMYTEQDGAFYFVCGAALVSVAVNWFFDPKANTRYATAFVRRYSSPEVVDHVKHSSTSP